MSGKRTTRRKVPQPQLKGGMGVGRWIMLIICLLMTGWLGLLFVHLAPVLMVDKPVAENVIPVETPNLRTSPPVQVHTQEDSVKKPIIASAHSGAKEEPLDESYHIVFSTGCSEFQDWQSIGVSFDWIFHVLINFFVPLFRVCVTLLSVFCVISLIFNCRYILLPLQSVR